MVVFFFLFGGKKGGGGSKRRGREGLRSWLGLAGLVFGVWCLGVLSSSSSLTLRVGKGWDKGGEGVG